MLLTTNGVTHDDVGDPVSSRTAPPPELTEDEQAERRRRAADLAAEYRTEMLG